MSPLAHLARFPDERILRMAQDAGERNGPLTALVIAELHRDLETKLHRGGSLAPTRRHPS